MGCMPSSYRGEMMGGEVTPEHHIAMHSIDVGMQEGCCTNCCEDKANGDDGFCDYCRKLHSTGG